MLPKMETDQSLAMRRKKTLIFSTLVSSWVVTLGTCGGRLKFGILRARIRTDGRTDERTAGRRTEEEAGEEEEEGDEAIRALESLFLLLLSFFFSLSLTSERARLQGKGDLSASSIRGKTGRRWNLPRAKKSLLRSPSFWIPIKKKNNVVYAKL